MMNILKSLLRHDLKQFIKKLRYNFFNIKFLDSMEKKYNLQYLAQREAEKKFFKLTPLELEKTLKGKKIHLFDMCTP